MKQISRGIILYPSVTGLLTIAPVMAQTDQWTGGTDSNCVGGTPPNLGFTDLLFTGPGHPNNTNDIANTAYNSITFEGEPNQSASLLKGCGVTPAALFLSEGNCPSPARSPSAQLNKTGPLGTLF